MANSKDQTRERVMQHFSEEMQRGVEKKGWTKKRLKETSGVSIERYKVDDSGREPTLSSAVRIADALEMSLDLLCGRSQYIQDTDNPNAGECLRMIVSLLEHLGGNVSGECGYVDLKFPPSNVTDIICEMLTHKAEYEQYYEGAKKFAPDSNPKPVYVETREFLERKMTSLKETGEPVEIKLYGSDHFEAFDGSVFVGEESYDDSGNYGMDPF